MKILEISKVGAQDMGPSALVQGKEREPIVVDAPADARPVQPIKDDVVARDESRPCSEDVGLSTEGKSPIWLRA